MGSGLKSQSRRLFFFFWIFILLHGNAPVICKRGLHAQKIAETILHSQPYLKPLRTSEKALPRFFVPSLRMHLILPKDDIAQGGSHCPSISPILYVWLKTNVMPSPPTYLGGDKLLVHECAFVFPLFPENWKLIPLFLNALLVCFLSFIYLSHFSKNLTLWISSFSQLEIFPIHSVY